MADGEDKDVESEADENPVVTYTTPTGQQVTLSREALETYGADYINQAALSTGKKRVLFADETVLEDAKEKFPDSKWPMVEMYSDYLPDASDVMSALIGQKNTSAQDHKDDIDEESINTEINDGLESKINDNSPAAISQPNGNASLIVIPSPSSVDEDGDFKDDMIAGLSSVDKKYFGDMPGTNLDWAKIAVSHEIGHIVNDDSGKKFQNAMNHVSGGIINSPAANIQQFRTTLEGEIRADISAARDFNKVSGAQPPVPQAMADLRIMGDFMTGSDLIDMGGRQRNEYVINDHNTGQDMQNYLDTGKTDINLDRTQFTSGYTNTLVRGLVGAVKGEGILKNSNVISTGRPMDSPVSNTMDTMLSPKEFDRALAGDDPTRLVSLGRQQSDAREIYGATKALLENGSFDDAPDAKQQAQRFVTAIERDAPGAIDPAIVKKYQDRLDDPKIEGYIDQLHRYNNPNLTIGYLYGGAANIPGTAPSPAPVQ